VKIWTKILSIDIKFACAKEIDKRLWAILKKPIEGFSKDKKKDENSAEGLVKVTETSMNIIKEIIQKISQVYFFPCMLSI
jgi:hypothetical protein